MENNPKKLSVGPKYLMDRQMSAFPMDVGSSNTMRFIKTFSTLENEFNKEKEEKEERDIKTDLKFSKPVGLTWIQLFSKLTIHDSKKGKSRLGGVTKHNKLHLKRTSAFANPVQGLDNWLLRFGPVMKDKGIQTDLPTKPCPLCLREEARRIARQSREHPSIIDQAAQANSHFKDASVEAPDRTYYGSDQLTYFRFGNFVYRGWTYRTLDGRIEHVPRVPIGIPLDQLRVEKPLRSPASV